jgi:thioredoxin 1
MVANAQGERSMASKNVKELTPETFAPTVAEGVVLVDFWAPWCGPCRMQGPILEDLATDLPEGCTVAKVNVDEAHELAAKFRVSSIPTLLVLRQGKVVQEFVGVQTASTLRQALEAASVPA